MNFLAQLVFISIVFFDQLYGAANPQHFVTMLNNGQVSSSSSFSGGTAGATVVALDSELGRKMNEAIGKHTQSVLQKSQENMKRTLANSQNFSRRLQADIQASVQRSLANTQASIAQALSSAGLFPPGLSNPVPNFKPEPFGGGFGNLFGAGDSFAKTLNEDISRTIAESQAESQKLQANIHKITNEALHKAAKNGQLKVITAPGGGPLNLVSSSVNGQGIILSGGQPGGVVHVVSESYGGNPNLRIFSNVPIQVKGVHPHEVKGVPPVGVGKHGSLPFPPSVSPPLPKRVYLPQSANIRDNIIEPGH